MTGAELKELRKAGGYRANRLAEALDVSGATLSKYENGRAPIPRKVELAVRYLCEPALHAAEEASADKRLLRALRELISERPGND